MEDIGADSIQAIVKLCSSSFKPFLDQLPKIDLVDGLSLYNFNGFWYPPKNLEATKSIQSNFVAKDDDIILTSSIKTEGTTWLKALVYFIMHDDGPKSITEHDYDPLATNHPAVLVPTLEAQTFVADPNPDLSSFESPRIFHTHIPYVTLPDSVKNSGCKIVYIVRNPKDTFVSMWHFLNHVIQIPFDMSFERYCEGVHIYGPFFEHVLQYWNESLRAPQKILFLKYKDLKKDPKGEVKKLASFLGKTLDDEQTDRVISRCSIDRLKNLEVNKSGVVPFIGMPKSSFFRLGVVGDWKNILTPQMKDRLDQITKIKLEGSGLHLDDASCKSAN